MKHMLAYTQQFLVSILLLTFGLSVYGCSDSVSGSNDVQIPLSSLTITPPGALQPAFSSNTTSYAAEVPTATTSITVTASPKDNTTTMTINGVATAAGQGHPVTLGLPGTTTTVSILLSSQTGLESTYTVTVTRLLSSDNNLKTLTVAPGTLSPAFDANHLDYTVDVGTKVPSVDITATKDDPNAVISGNVPNEGQATILLDGPGTSKTISITVTAPNGNLKTYSITVNRAAPSSDSNLSTLTVTGGTLSPAFTPDGLTYTVDVAPTQQTATVSATKSDPDAVISGDLPNEGSKSFTLGGPGASQTISIIVTAQDTVTTKTYTITIINGISR